MLLNLTRSVFTDKSTTGDLAVDGTFEAFTLEDVARPKKIKHQTCVPSGRYQVIINHSERFNRDLPLLVNVPGFEGIRIHPGNTDKDTSGCVLVGKTKSADFVGNSRAAFDALFAKIKGALDSGEEVEIEITGGFDKVEV
ncbi:MAG TPA: DUF5675 family protein [Blastocatellia bacterium]|nr:DUF5675 family protein [Blastocatellia bacterium]